MPRGPRGEIRPADVIGKCRKSQAICIATDLIWFEVCPRFVADSTLEGDWIRSSSTRARKVGCRAPTAAKSNGSTTTLSMRIGDLRSARTPHQGQEGKDIVVLDRWAEDRTEGAVSSLARYRYYEGSRSGPAVTACQHYFENRSFSRDVMRQSSRAVLRQKSNGVRSCSRV